MDKDDDSQQPTDQDLLRYLIEIPPIQWERIDALLGRSNSDDLAPRVRLASHHDTRPARLHTSATNTGSEVARRTLEIVVAYSNGESPETIAAALQSTTKDVREVLQEAGVALRDHGHTSNEIRNQIRALSDQGLSTRAIGRRLGVSHTTVSRILRRTAKG